MELKNKGLVDSHNQHITDIDNTDVNLIEIESIKTNSGFPQDTIGKCAFLIIYNKDTSNKYFYILIDEIGREYYLRSEVEFDISNSKFILVGNQVLDRWWNSTAMEGDTTHSYSDVTNIITTIAPRYNPDEVNRLVDALAHKDEHVHFFKRDGANNYVSNIHHYHHFPRVNVVDTVIRMTVHGRNSNTDYRIWYHNWQGGWEDALVMSAWRNSWMTEMRFGNYTDWDSEDLEFQHGTNRIVVRHRENGGIRDKEVLMNFDLQWKHLGNMGANGTVNIPGEAIDVMVVPRFISALDVSGLRPIPIGPGGGKAGRTHPTGGVYNSNVPLGYNPFIGSIFEFDLPNFFVPAGLDYGLHGTSYSLISRSNRQLFFGPGNLSSVATIGRHRDGSLNPNIRYPHGHYEVWWR